MEGATEVTLDEIYAGDPKLLKFYRKRLLEPGWAGELSPSEFAYIKSQLRLSPSLKRRWGFKPSAKRLSEKHIRAVATNTSLRHREASFSFSGKRRVVKQVAYHL